MNFEEVKELMGLNTLDFEGGYYNEIYRCKVPSSIPNRICGTSIYYALTDKTVSKWHKVASDEIWHYHAGTSVVQILLFEDGHVEKHIIGANLKEGERPQSIIPAGTWQAARLTDCSEGKWGLFGATVFPGFEFSDTCTAEWSELASKWPEAEKMVKEAKLDI